MRVFGSRRYGFVPGPASGGHRDDLLVWLHGSTQSATVTRRFTNRRFEHLGMSVAYPEGVARHWNDGRRLLQEKTRELGTNDVEYLTEFVHSFECTGRVFGAGFSNGGHMIYRLLHEAPGLFDAALVIAATQPTPENFLPTPPTANQRAAPCAAAPNRRRPQSTTIDGSTGTLPRCGSSRCRTRGTWSLGPDASPPNSSDPRTSRWTRHNFSANSSTNSPDNGVDKQELRGFVEGTQGLRHHGGHEFDVKPAAARSRERRPHRGHEVIAQHAPGHEL